MRRERPFQAWLQISMGCNSVCAYCIVPERPRPRASRARRRPARPRPQRLAADGVRELTLLGQNVNSYGPRPAASTSASTFAELIRALDRVDGLERVRYTSPAPQGHARRRDRRHGRVPRRLRAHAPAAAVGLVADPQAHAPHVRPRPLPGAGRPHPRRDAGHRPHDRRHRRLPGRDRGRLRRDRSTSTTQVGYDHAFTFIYSPRAAAPRPPACPTRCPRTSSASGSSGWSSVVQHHARRRNEALVGTRAGGAGRGHRAAPTRTCARRIARQQDGAFTSPARRGHAGRRCGSRPRRRRRCAARSRPVAASRRERVVALFGPTASGKSAVAVALAERMGGEIVSADAMQLLPRAADAHRTSRPPRTWRACRTTWSASGR